MVATPVPVRSPSCELAKLIAPKQISDVKARLHQEHGETFPVEGQVLIYTGKVRSRCAVSLQASYSCVACPHRRPPCNNKNQVLKDDTTVGENKITEAGFVVVMVTKVRPWASSAFTLHCCKSVSAHMPPIPPAAQAQGGAQARTAGAQRRAGARGECGAGGWCALGIDAMGSTLDFDDAWTRALELAPFAAKPPLHVCGVARCKPLARRAAHSSLLPTCNRDRQAAPAAAATTAAPAEPCVCNACRLETVSCVRVGMVVQIGC